MFISIKGFVDLTEEQRDLLLRVNKKHIDGAGSGYKLDREVMETWVDEDNNVCVRTRDGEWYHYYKDETWG